MDTVNEFIDHTFKNTFIKLTLSKPRPFSPYKNIFIRKVKIKEQTKYQVTYRTATQDQVQNFDKDALHIQLQLWLMQTFFFADMLTKKEEIRLMQSKKGQVTITRKKAQRESKSFEHDIPKDRLINESSTFLYELGLSSTNGKVFGHAQKKFKQINRYVELINALIGNETVSTIVDMGSGKGYLTFALYEYLYEKNKDVRVKGIELREDLVDKCMAISKKLKFSGLSFEKGSIEDISLKKTNLVIALHACDTATDMAIAKGINAEAKFIAVAPCCHKQIRKAMKDTGSVLQPIIDYGIHKERMAEMVTDTIRALLLESKGYTTKIFEFISLEHTAKNVLITAKFTGKKNDSALEKIKRIKEEFGIDQHFLEHLI